ncbi:MAG TPA: protein kinase, partial [Polyangiaceae bacterium]
MSIEAHTSRSSGTLPASGDEGASSVELPRGAPVGRYLILEKIGAGGMGVVYSAYDPKLDRRIALKALHTATDPERDTAGRSRLIREAKAMARLSHPNVVTVYDVLAEGE